MKRILLYYDTSLVFIKYYIIYNLFNENCVNKILMIVFKKKSISY